MRGFEKISFEQFKKDVKDDRKLYEEYKLPERKTKHSVGYDFLAIEDIKIKKGETKKIPTGYKVFMKENETLFMIVRSSMGIKKGLRLSNQVGVFECDYYNNIDNEGHMYASIKNEGEEDVIIKKGEGYVQGIFLNFLTAGDVVETERVGGIGSTNKKEG